MKIPNELKVVTAALMVVVVFLALFYFGDQLGFATNIETEFVQVLPGLFIFIVGMLIVATVKGVFTLPGMMIVGVGVAYLFGTLDTMGYITSQMLTGLTIAQLQLWIIIISTLFGAIAAAYTR